MNRSNATSFKLVFSHKEEVEYRKELSLHITSTVLPSVTINPVEMPWQGGVVYGEGGGVEFGNWETSFFIDDTWSNYQMIYDWMANINNGYDFYGRKDFSYQMDAALMVMDNFKNIITTFEFINIWPSSLSEVNLSYQEGETNLSCNVTFVYDYFYKKI